MVNDFSEDAAVQALVTALLQFERETGVYIPRKLAVAKHVHRTVSAPLVAEALRLQAKMVSRPEPVGNTMYCDNRAEHNTHMWTPPWDASMLVRCPGRDGV